jgi:hypothetical protein
VKDHGPVRWFLLAVLAFGACSGSLGGKDAGGPATIVGAGGARLDAAISTGGTGLDDAGVPTGSGGGSSPNCPSGEGAPAPFGACDSAGMNRSGYVCYSDGTVVNWTVICCSGVWENVAHSPDAVTISCPTLRPGDRFACGSTGLTCVAGESYCYERNDPDTKENLASCEPLCAAGDCTCFCADPLACTYRPPNATCMRDSCRCEPPRASNSLWQPGGVRVSCTLDRAATQLCTRTADACDTDGGTIYHCETGGVTPPDPSCALRQYGLVCDTLWIDYCCPS